MRGGAVVATLAAASVALAGLAVGAPSAVATTGAAEGRGAAVVAGASRADGPHVRTWWGDALQLDKAHRQATGKGVVIALLDDGIQPDVPALKGAKIEMRRSYCLAYGALSRSKPARFETGKASRHGTLMASLLVGNGNGYGGPGTGIMGVAPDATLRFYDLNRGRTKLYNDGLDCTPYDILQTAQVAVRQGADVVLMSFGNAFTEDEKAWKALGAQNKAVLVASSNTVDKGGRHLGFPAGTPGILSVNALDGDYKPVPGSLTLRDTSTGKITSGWYTPSISAPGYKLDADGAAEDYGPGSYFSGTSPAAAFVAGTAALVRDKYPRATAAQVVQDLVHHTTRDDLTGSARIPDMTWGFNTGFGPVSPVNALAHDPAGWPDENPLLIPASEVAGKYPSRLEGRFPKAAASASAAPSSSASPAAAAAADRGSGAQDTADDGSGGTSPLWWVLGALVLAALAAAGAVLARRGRTGGDPSLPGTGGPPAAGPTTDDTHDSHRDRDDGLRTAGGQ